MKPNQARTQHAFGEALEAVGFNEQTATDLREAERIFDDLGIQPDPAPA